MPPKKKNADPAPAAKPKAPASNTTTKPAAKAAASKPATAGRGRPKKTDPEPVPKTTKATVKKVTKKVTKESAPAAAAGASKTQAQPTKKEPAKRATAKASTTMSTTASKKRKAEEAEEEKPRAPKKPRVIREPKPKIVKPKAVAPKVVINEVPTTRLNVFVCGEGSSGELGLGAAKNAIDVKRPRLNKFLDAQEVGVVQIAVGGMHCLALTHDNKIFTWGVNDQGALGRDTTWDGGYKEIKEDAGSDSDSDEEDDSGLNPRESTPTAIPSTEFPDGTVFVAVAAADSASFALTDDGQVYGWGTFRVS
jgi:regulator of chromosome condensation